MLNDALSLAPPRGLALADARARAQRGASGCSCCLEREEPLARLGGQDAVDAPDEEDAVEAGGGPITIMLKRSVVRRMKRPV